MTKVTFIFWLLCLTPLCAQPPQPFGRDPFYEAMREAHHHLIANRELLELLRHESVQEEIGLSSENYELIRSYIKEGFGAVLELRGTGFDKEVLLQKILESHAPWEEKIFQLLRDPENADFPRLLGIYVQSRGFRAATSSLVAERIGLSGKEFEDYRQTRADVWQRLMDENRDKMGRLIREGDRKQIATLFEAAEKTLDKALAAQLSEEQKKSLHLLEGERFDLPKQSFDKRRRSRSRRDDDHSNGNDKENCCPADELPYARR